MSENTATMLCPEFKGVDEYIKGFYGVPLSSLIAPVGDNVVGESVRHNGVYFNIKKARQADDPTLPQGVWRHELKIADWHEVQNLAVDALCTKSKDLQLGVWLFESSVQIHKFAGVAPAAILLKALCEEYWDTMHPQMVDGDLEYRTNPINWINEKITPRLRLFNITDTLLDGREYNWDDWENGLRYEQLKRQNKHSGEWDGPNPKAFKQRLAASHVNGLKAHALALHDGLTAVGELQAWLDEKCASDSPSLSDMMALMESIRHLVEDELTRRGVRLAATDEEDSQDGAGGEQVPPSSGGGGGAEGASLALQSREDAFVMLRRAAQYLMQDDPHSPVPYLVNTACDWGEKSAPDLYQDLFLKQGGQLNIFEIMGLDVERRE